MLFGNTMDWILIFKFNVTAIRVVKKKFGAFVCSVPFFFLLCHLTIYLTFSVTSPLIVSHNARYLKCIEHLMITQLQIFQTYENPISP